MKIPFCIPVVSSESLENIKRFMADPDLVEKRNFLKKCTRFFEEQYPGYKALMTASCTRALDLIAISLDFQIDEEIIMPSFNYVGVANAFVNAGARLVFADVHPDTMNISLASVKRAVTTKTRAVLAMHYNGCGGEIEEISEFCKERNIVLIEDNAQGIGTLHNTKMLGSYGDFSCVSFDRIKNISCGEGGVLLYQVKYEDKILSAFHNGTNRPAFDRGEVKAYEWVGKGSKFDMSEYCAAILFPMLEDVEAINERRKERWNRLHDSLDRFMGLNFALPLEKKNNGHIFFLKLRSKEQRDKLSAFLDEKGIDSYFHYMPLHSSPMSIKSGYEMPVDDFTTIQSDRLLRLPIYNSIPDEMINYMAETIDEFFKANTGI